MALTDRLKAIGNVIRTKTGKTAKLTLEQMQQEISGISTANEFLKNRTVAYLFTGLNYETIPDSVMSKVDLRGITDLTRMFFGNESLKSIPVFDTSGVKYMINTFNLCTNLETIPLLNTSNVLNMSSMCQNCPSLTTFPEVDTRNVVSMKNMLYQCSALTSLPLFDMSSNKTTEAMLYKCSSLTTIPAFDMRACDNANYMLYDCKSLSECWLRNINTSLQVGSGTSWGHLLTLESLLHLIKELITNDNESMEFTIGSANLEKLNNVYVRTITITDEMRTEDEFIDQKLPFEVCESTDEGAMLINQYAKLKNWTIK